MRVEMREAISNIETHYYSRDVIDSMVRERNEIVKSILDRIERLETAPERTMARNSMIVSGSIGLMSLMISGGSLAFSIMLSVAGKHS